MIISRRTRNSFAALLLLTAAPTAFAGSINYLYLYNNTTDGGNPSGLVEGNVTYNSTTGLSPVIASGNTTTYSGPTALGLTAGTVQMSSINNLATGTLTASSYATGNLATGSVGVYAFPSVCCGGPPNVSDADSEAIIRDSLTFNVAGANSSTVTDIGIAFTVDGSVSPGTQANEADAVLTDSMAFGNGIIDYVYNTGSNSIIENQGWVTNTIASEGPNSFIFAATYALTGSTDTLAIQLELDLQCQADASCDVSHTGAVSFVLPPNVTFTSQSGVFLSQPLTAAPEPAYSAVPGFGLLGIAILLRRRNRRVSAV